VTHRRVLKRLKASGEVPRAKKMLLSETDPESYLTEYTSVYEDDSRRITEKRNERGAGLIEGETLKRLLWGA
jgi:hypothetical protein